MSYIGVDRPPVEQDPRLESIGLNPADVPGVDQVDNS